MASFRKSETATARLHSFFQPRSVAVVGVSSDPVKPASRAVRFLVKQGAEKIYAIGRSIQEISGAEVLNSVGELPGPVDVCLIALRADQVLPTVQEAHAKGISNFVVFSAGFSELGGEGRRLEEELSDYCRRHDLALIGPNTMGIVNFSGLPSLTFASLVDDHVLPPGDVAVVTQSGAVAGVVAKLAAEAALGLSHIVPTGNEAVVTASDVIDYLLDRPEIRSVVLYMEQVRGFERLVESGRKARRMGKHIIVIVGGTTSQGMRAAASHTGAIGGDMVIARSLLEGEGAFIANTPAEAISILLALRLGIVERTEKRTSPQELGCAIVTGSGGMGVLMTDLLSSARLGLAALAQETVEELARILPPHASLANPVDVTATVNLSPAPLQGTIRCLARDAAVDALIFMTSGPSQRVVQFTVEAAASAKAEGKSLAVVWPDAPMEGRRGVVENGGVVFFRLEDAALGLRQIDKTRGAAPGEKAQAIVRNEQVFREDHLKRRLSASGLKVPEHALAVSREEALRSGERLGYPVVLKLVSPSLAHKTELSAVRVDLRSSAELGEAFETMRDAVRRQIDADEMTFLVERLARPGIDMVLSLQRRADLTALMIGAGGIAVELSRDIAFCDAAGGTEAIRAALGRTQMGGFLLHGRGRGFDAESLVEAAAKLARFFEATPQMRELEINPIRVHAKGEGVTILDAKATG